MIVDRFYADLIRPEHQAATITREPKPVEPHDVRIGRLIRDPFIQDLADFVEGFIVQAVTRVKGTGDDQYSDGDVQKFETKDVDDIFQDAQEELYDVVNYAIMLSLRLDQLQKDIAASLEEVANGG